MRIFVVTVAKRSSPGAATSPDVGRRIDQALSDPVWLIRDADRRESWVSRSGAVRIDAVSNEPPSTGSLIQRYASGNAATWSGRIDDPSFVADHPTPSAVAGLPGSFALVAATDDGADGFTCVHRMEALYVAEGRDIFVISSRAGVAHAVAAIPDHVPPIDALLGLSGAGRMINDATPFPGVTAAPGDTHLAIRSAGVTVSRLPGPDIDPTAPIEELADLFIDRLVAAAEVAGKGSAPVVELTGGKDSRLVAVALAAAGVPFTAMTSGHEAHPDVVFAKRVADALKVSHSVQHVAEASGAVAAKPAERAYLAVRGCEGMVSCYDAFGLAGRYELDRVRVGGQVGELLRGGSGLGVGASSPSEVRTRVLDFLAPHRELLSPSAGTRMGEILAPWLDGHETNPYRASAELFRVLGAGRWYAALRMPRTINGPIFEFLADNQLARIVFTADPEAVAHDALVHAAIHRLRPDICRIPLVGSRWGFERNGPTPYCDPAHWADRDPVPRLGGTAWDWRDKYPVEVHRHFADTILSAPLFDGFMDRDKTREFLDVAASPNRIYPHVRLSWSLYTASQLLHGIGSRRSAPEFPRFDIAIPKAAQDAERLNRHANPDEADLALCNFCYETFVQDQAVDGVCPACGLGPEHRSLRFVLDNYGDVFQGRAILALGAAASVAPALLQSAAAVRRLEWTGELDETILDQEPAATQDAVAILQPATVAANSALLDSIARVLRPGGVLVAVEAGADANGNGHAEPRPGHVASLAAEAGLAVTTLPGLDPALRRTFLITFAYRVE